MQSDSVERRLAAILSADVFGYSRLMADDEAATVRTLIAYREQVEALLGDHRGRLVDFTGDNFLAEFSTALDSVRCAVEIQRVLAARNAHLPPERHMAFRIGIHLGDILVERDRIYGDGVNIAARLQSLAQPGGVCISATVHEQVRRKLEVAYEDLGDRLVKNIPDAVHAYLIRLDPSGIAGGWWPLQRKHLPLGLVLATAAAIVITWPLLMELPERLSGVETTMAPQGWATVTRSSTPEVGAGPTLAERAGPEPGEEDEISSVLEEDPWMDEALHHLQRKHLDCDIKSTSGKLPRVIIEEGAKQVIMILKDEADLVTKRERIEATVCGWFDITTMSKLVLATGWPRLIPSDQVEFAYEFKRYLTFKYGRRIAGYKGEDAAVYGERTGPRGDVTVRTRMVGGNYDGALVDYRFREKEGTWLIIDIIIEDLSLVSNYRDQFKAIIGRKGPDGLIAELHSYNTSKSAMAVEDNRLPVYSQGPSSQSK